MRTAVLLLVSLLGIAPLAHAAPPAAAPAESLDRYVGQYQLAANRMITISRDGARLFAQNSDAPKVELLARGGAEFAYANINVRLKFQGDDGGKARELVVSSGGVERLARRLSTAEAGRIEMLSQTEVAVDPKVLDEYVGFYEVQEPPLLFRFTREGDDLFAQIIGQPKVQIYARSPREFIYRIVPVRIVFRAPVQGRAPGFVFTQSDVDYTATRLDDRQGERKADELRTAAAAPPPPPRATAAVPAERLARHVGTYRMNDLDMSVTISLDGAQLYSQTTFNGTATPKQALLAETEAKFYFKDAPLRFTFEPGPTASTRLLIDSGGQRSVAVRKD